MLVTRDELLALDNDILFELLANLEPGMEEYVNSFIYGFLGEDAIEIPDGQIPPHIYFMFIDDSGNTSKYLNDE